MTLDIKVKRESSNYYWQCPYCESKGLTKYNKSCFYQLVEHCKKHHLNVTFENIVNNKTRVQKSNLIDANWGFFGKNIKTLEDSTNKGE